MSRFPEGGKGAGDQGLVLLGVLVAMALLGSSTAASLWLMRTEFLSIGARRAGAQAWYSADAALRHGLAVLAPDIDLEALRGRSAQALVDPLRPGPWPIGSGGWTAFPGPPFGYRLEILPGEEPVGSSDRLQIRAHVRAVRETSLILEAMLGLDSEPDAPAALVLGGGGVQIESGGRGSLAAPGVELVGEAALATTSRADLGRALEVLEEGLATVDGTTSASARFYDVDRLARRNGIEVMEAASVPGHFGGGRPAIARIDGGRLEGLEGSGVFLAAGDLEIDGPVAFEGVLVVGGTLRLSGRGCSLRGMVRAERIEFAAPCRLVRHPPAIRLADGILRLPRLPRLISIRVDPSSSGGDRGPPSPGSLAKK